MSEASLAGFSWSEYVAWLIATEGSLARAAERLSESRGYRDDVASIERALRRLRVRETGDGGAWGRRCLALFGVPGAVEARAAWLGAYHSRFTDLPVPLCEDLLRVWDVPPVSTAPRTALWVLLARVSCALRAARMYDARRLLATCRPIAASAPVTARAELLLTDAFAASRESPDAVGALLDAVEPLLDDVRDAGDRACLRARWVDQRAWQLNKGRGGAVDHAGAEALYRALPTEGVPAFALCRRANGMAYARHVAGDREGATRFAREACAHAGDGGHLRLRAMSLQMLARVSSGDEAAEAKARALSIARSLDDEALRLRFERR